MDFQAIDIYISVGLIISKDHKEQSKFIRFFLASCLSWVPEQGTVGASGDLAPLSHLALGLMGEGQMWSPETGWGDAKYVSWLIQIDIITVKIFLRTTICFDYFCNP